MFNPEAELLRIDLAAERVVSTAYRKQSEMVREYADRLEARVRQLEEHMDGIGCTPPEPKEAQHELV